MTKKRYAASSKTQTNPAGRVDEEKRPPRRNRIRYACKPELKQLIDLVNLVPPDLEMKDIHDLVEGAQKFQRIGTPEWKATEFKLAEAFRHYLLTSFPQGFLRVITTPDEYQILQDLYQKAQQIPDNALGAEIKAIQDEIESKVVSIFQQQASSYYRLRAFRRSLYRLAEIGQEPEKHLGQSLQDVVLNIALIEYAYLDNDGIIRLPSNPLAEAINGIEVARIRACLICRKLFWATRKDKRCCSEEHARIVRQRQVRENQRINKDVYTIYARRRKQSIFKGDKNSGNI